MRIRMRPRQSAAKHRFGSGSRESTGAAVARHSTSLDDPLGPPASPPPDARPSKLELDLGLLMLRTVVGGFFLPHALAESLGWLGGPGLTGFAAELQHWGLPSAAPIPFFLAAVQIILGTLLVLGAITRISSLIAALLLLVNAVVHAPQGWLHGVEHPTFWCGMLLAVAILGPGRLSVDAWLGGKDYRLSTTGNGSAD